MATKPLDFLNRLPSVSELLEKQPVRTLAERLNRSVVAAGVRTFLDELRADLRRRAADVPSIRELAERAAQFVVSQQQYASQSIINATGQVVGGPWAGVPIADTALEQAVTAARNFTLSPHIHMADTRAWPTRISVLAGRETGAQAAVAVHSYAGAVWLALAALASGREVLVSRAEVGEIDAIGPLPSLITAAGALVRDVGTANRTTAADYGAAVTPQAAVLLRLQLDGYRIVGETQSASISELAAVAQERNLALVSAIGAAPLVPSAELAQWPRQSVREVLEAGADLVVARGDGLVGGPTCGLLLGTQAAIDRIREHALFPVWEVDALRGELLVATLQHYADNGKVEQSLPLWQLLTAPVDNLRNRAERMAPQMAQGQGIAAAAPVEVRSPLCAAFGDAGRPSYGVSLTATDDDVRSLDARLRQANASVWGRLEGNSLVLDLRTVFPRQDRLLVETVVGRPLTDEIAPAAEPVGGSG